MKLYDQATMDLAQAVQDVLEGKAPLQEMDPAKHVVQNKDTGMFCVYNNDGKKVKEFKDEADAVKYAKDNHDKLMETDKDSLDDSGEKMVKDHKPKVTDLTAEETDLLHGEALTMHEASDKESKYKAFFDKALKKYGVKSPAELEGDKKKEFFDYVDANYEAENEAD